MATIDLKELAAFQSTMEQCFFKSGVKPTFKLGNDYSLSFAYQKYLNEAYKQSYIDIQTKWHNYLSFLLLAFNKANPNTYKQLISLYNTVENAFLLVSFLRVSGSFAIIRGVYENIMRVLFALHENPGFDYENDGLLKIKDLEKKLQATISDSAFIDNLCKTYTSLCDHSHIKLIQPEQILQEDYIEKLLLEAKNGLILHEGVLALCIEYLLLLFPDTLYKFNSMSQAWTDLIRRDFETFDCMFTPRFYYLNNMGSQRLKELIKGVDLSPQNSLDSFSLAEIYLILRQTEDAHTLLSSLTETEYFKNHPGCFISLMLTSKLKGDNLTYNAIFNRINELGLNRDYVSQYTNNYISQFPKEMACISDVLGIS